MIIINCGVFNILNDNISENVIKSYKSYNVRPLAFFSDAYVFQWFSENMYILLLVMLIMHAFNVYFVYRICEKIDIKLNSFSLVLIALAPILVEALYWISASTRIVVSLFFCLASIYLLLLSFEQENKIRKCFLVITAVLLNLMCVGYYEQTIALNLFLFTFVLVCAKKYWYIILPVVSTGWIGVYYIHFMMTGEMQSRGALELSGIIVKAREYAIMLNDRLIQSLNTFLNLLGEGTNLILKSSLTILLLVFLSFVVFYMSKNKYSKDENKHIIKKLLIGLIMYISPVLPFLVLQDSYISMRNMYLPFIGFAIVLELLVDLMLKLVKNEDIIQITKDIMVGTLIIIFVFSNIAASNSYKKINEIDNEVSEEILKVITGDEFESYKTISVNYDAEEFKKIKYTSNTVECSMEAGWALMGKLQVERGDIDIGMIYINEKSNECDIVLDVEFKQEDNFEKRILVTRREV